MRRQLRPMFLRERMVKSMNIWIISFTLLFHFFPSIHNVVHRIIYSSLCVCVCVEVPRPRWVILPNMAGLDAVCFLAYFKEYSITNIPPITNEQMW